MFVRLVLGLCVVLTMGALSSADARRWHRHHWHHHSYYGDRDRLISIAESDVDLSLDHYTIDVSQAKGAYKGIRIKNVMGRLFDVRRVQIVYSDGSVWNEDRQIDMYWGERSRPINPTSESRFIDKIKITQEPGDGRGRLQIIGIQSPQGRRMDRNGDEGRYSQADRSEHLVSDDRSESIPVKPTVPIATPTAPGQQTAGGDVLFGAQYVGFLTDRDVIRVGNEVGKFAKIRLRVLDNDIHIKEMKVVYNNGESDTLAVNADIPKNSRTSWIDLRGDRFIKEIQLVYRSRPNFNGQARIEVFGRYAPGWLRAQRRRQQIQSGLAAAGRPNSRLRRVR